MFDFDCRYRECTRCGADCQPSDVRCGVPICEDCLSMLVLEFYVRHREFEAGDLLNS